MISMISLVSVYRNREAEGILYDLLAERPAEANISHKAMPTRTEHHAFLMSVPYRAWYIILNEEGEAVGTTYVTKASEVGIFVFARHQGKGYAKQAIAEVKTRWGGRLLANIAPSNVHSIRFFESLGARLIQHTYEL